MSVRENDRLQFAILQFFKYVAIRSVENLVFVISWKNHVSTAPDNSTFDVAPALGLRWQGGDLKPAVLPGVACCTVITAARPRSVEWYLQVLRKWARHASLSTNSKHFQQVSKVFWDLLFSLAVPFQGRLNERFRCRHPHQITVKLSMAETNDLPRKHYCPLMRGILDTVDMDGYGRLMYSDSCLCHPPNKIPVVSLPRIREVLSWKLPWASSAFFSFVFSSWFRPKRVNQGVAPYQVPSPDNLGRVSAASNLDMDVFSDGKIDNHIWNMRYSQK